LYICKIINNQKQIIMTLTEAKNNGNKIVYLNGFKESINYVMGLSNIVWVDEVKSYDGYSTIQCYEQN